MTYSRIIVLVLVTFCGLGTRTSADTITREEFLSRLEKTHPLFAQKELSIQIAEDKRLSYMGDQDWSVRSSVLYSHDEPIFAVAGPEELDALVIDGGIERAFWSTGGKLSASLSSTYADLTIDPLMGIPNTYFENRFSVTYSHPLLRNSRGSLDRLQYDLAQFDIDLSEVLAVESEEVFLAQAASKYLDWVLLEEQLRIVVERLHLSEEEVSRTREKREANLVDEVDVIRAEDAVRVAKQELLLIEARTNALKAELAVLLQDSSLIALEPSYNLYEKANLPASDEAADLIRGNSRLLRALAIQIDRQSVVHDGYVEQGKSDLSLIAQAGLKNAETSYGSSLAMDIPEVRLGLQLSFPVGNTTAKANAIRSDLVAQRLEKQVEELTLELSSVAANILTQAAQLETVLQLNREQIESAEQKTAEELKLYEQGRGELTFVIQSRDSEQAARLTYAINALTYHKLLLQLQELTDQLHE
jgi:outer membrane protein TolC